VAQSFSHASVHAVEVETHYFLTHNITFLHNVIINNLIAGVTNLDFILSRVEGTAASRQPHAAPSEEIPPKPMSPTPYNEQVSYRRSTTQLWINALQNFILSPIEVTAASHQPQMVMVARLSENWDVISHTVMDQWDHLLVLEFNHVLDSSVAVVDIHSTHLRGGTERQT